MSDIGTAVPYDVAVGVCAKGGNPASGNHWVCVFLCVCEWVSEEGERERGGGEEGETMIVAIIIVFR